MPNKPLKKYLIKSSCKHNSRPNATDCLAYSWPNKLAKAAKSFSKKFDNAPLPFYKQEIDFKISLPAFLSKTHARLAI